MNTRRWSGSDARLRGSRDGTLITAVIRYRLLWLMVVADARVDTAVTVRVLSFFAGETRRAVVSRQGVSARGELIRWLFVQEPH
jgi:hypothetical protein